MKRFLTEEEQLLWQQATQHDAPLQPRHMQVTMPLPAIQINHKPTYGKPTHATTPQTPLSPGNYAGIDRNTAERFRKGQTTLDGTLDLHGMNREKAHRLLSDFLHAHAARGSRCLLVITGKGLRNHEGGQGVLRELLPRWLGEPDLCPLVLAFDSAPPKLGGSGAFTILLKRKR